MVELLLLYVNVFVKMIRLSPSWGRSKTIKTNIFFRKLQK